MPWREFAENWLSALSSSYQATFLGVEKENEMAVFELDRRIPTQRDLRLTFPCGQGLTGRPVWQRTPPDGSKTTLVGFCTHELGLTTPDLEQFEEANQARKTPRVPTRIWAKLAPLRPHGTVTEDVSLRGCRLEGQYDELVGETVELELDLRAHGEPTVVHCKVVWSAVGSTGLEFVNLSVVDEAAILKLLGKDVDAAEPSRFIPGGGAAAPNCYALSTEGEETLLYLAVPNWDFRFRFTDVTVEGEPVGCFHRFYALESSTELKDLRAKLQIGLEHSRSLVHLYLFDAEENIVLDLCGREGFHERTHRKFSTQ